MRKKIAVIVIFSLVTTLSSYAHESERVEQLERDVQETKERISRLESMLNKNSGEKEYVATGDGWKSVANWRKLATDMNEGAVRRILGEPHKIDGGGVATWYYKNEGRVVFISGKVASWYEP